MVANPGLRKQGTCALAALQAADMWQPLTALITGVIDQYHRYVSLGIDQEAKRHCPSTLVSALQNGVMPGLEGPLQKVILAPVTPLPFAATVTLFFLMAGVEIGTIEASLSATSDASVSAGSAPTATIYDVSSQYGAYSEAPDSAPVSRGVSLSLVRDLYADAAQVCLAHYCDRLTGLVRHCIGRQAEMPSVNNREDFCTSLDLMSRETPTCFDGSSIYAPSRSKGKSPAHPKVVEAVNITMRHGLSYLSVLDRPTLSVMGQGLMDGVVGALSTLLRGDCGSKTTSAPGVTDLEADIVCMLGGMESLLPDTLSADSLVRVCDSLLSLPAVSVQEPVRSKALVRALSVDMGARRAKVVSTSPHILVTSPMFRSWLDQQSAAKEELVDYILFIKESESKGREKDWPCDLSVPPSQRGQYERLSIATAYQLLSKYKNSSRKRLVEALVKKLKVAQKAGQ
ncbi:hypothetical protein KIPB_008205 [Kipferlia bialata]|uniref:Uncharacterized protein n=1 Tax=Kipferlia bialata TaxID=797122 RepID=A0A9K3D1C1_9EUKA|nr:hypothetical protein KIPB_008205 [Kipferlia bialata]|eukprot:g8205.t1